jgi:glycosyltransferase involved in cell wall biosynthesis
MHATARTQPPSPTPSSAQSASSDRSPLWITWEVTRRSRGLSSALGAQLHEINIKGNRLVRYWRSILETLRILRRSRGALVFVQSPSIVLANLATSVARRYGVTVIVDAHNGGIMPFEGRAPILRWLAERSLRNADLVIVTNRALADAVSALGAKAFVLTDPMPNWPASPPAAMALSGPRRIVAICTWASDEPVAELIAAASFLPAEYELSITGRPKLSESQRGALPKNVRLTGFVSEADYLSLLRNADVVVDLTTRENCLVCGAYEAIAMHKALVVSDTAALRELLADAAEYCRNDAREVADAIRRAAASRVRLEAHARSRDSALRETWQRHRGELSSVLGQLTERKPA